MRVAGESLAHGVGVHAPSDVTVSLNGAASALVQEGLDPQANYTLRELSPKPSAASALAQAGKTIRGDSLMRDGLALPLVKASHRVVVELAAVR